MMDPIKGFLFDLDGVIIDSNPVIELFWQQWAEKEGVPFNEEVIKNYIHGRPTWETIRTLFSKSSPATQQAIFDEAVVFDMTMLPGPIPGVDSFLQAVKAYQRPIMLVTSSPKERALNLLQANNLLHYFSAFITGEDVTRGKPDPEPYLKAAEKIRLDVKECLVFEDSDNGIKSAIAAGMRVVAINNPGFRDEKLVWNTENFYSLIINPFRLSMQGHPEYIALAD